MPCWRRSAMRSAVGIHPSCLEWFPLLQTFQELGRRNLHPPWGVWRLQLEADVPLQPCQVSGPWQRLVLEVHPFSQRMREEEVEVTTWMERQAQRQDRQAASFHSLAGKAHHCPWRWWRLLASRHETSRHPSIASVPPRATACCPLHDRHSWTSGRLFPTCLTNLACALHR